MSNQKAGKMPKTSTEDNSDFAGMTTDDSFVRIHPKLQQLLDKNDLTCRWLNKKDYVDNGNFHRSGWRALVLEDTERAEIAKVHGVSPDNTVIVRDLVLGVKSKEDQANHRSKIQKKTKAYSHNPNLTEEDLG